MWWVWIIYILCLVVMGYVSIKLAKYVDLLQHRTKLSGALLGGVLLAGITSLPELVTSITGAFMNEPDLTQGNIIGSNLFDVTIIGVVMIIYFNRIKNARLSSGNGVFLWVCTLITACIAIFVLFDVSIVIPFINVNFLTLLCITLYVLSLFLSNNADIADNANSALEPAVDSTLAVRQIVIRFIICSLVLVGVSIAITFASEYIAAEYGLGKGLAGALFLGVATSLPEIISTFAFVRLGNFNTAFCNIMGTCVFNYLVLAIADVCYYSGTVFLTYLQSVYLSICMLAICIFSFIFYALKRRKTKRSALLTITFGVLISLTYVTFLLLSAYCL